MVSACQLWHCARRSLTMRPQRVGTCRAVEQTQETCLIRGRDSEVATFAHLLSSLALCLIPEFPKLLFALTGRGCGSWYKLRAVQARNRASIFRAVFVSALKVKAAIFRSTLNYTPIDSVSYPRKLCSSPTTNCPFLTENTPFLQRQNQSVNVV